MKKILASVMLFLTLFSVISVDSFAICKSINEIRPRSYQWDVTYYGYCSGNMITITYNYEIPTRLPIVKTEKRLVIPGKDEFGGFLTPIVLYRYIDTEGNIITPYFDFIENKQNARRNEGYDGPCPTSLEWE